MLQSSPRVNQWMLPPHVTFFSLKIHDLSRCLNQTSNLISLLYPMIWETVQFLSKNNLVIEWVSHSSLHSAASLLQTSDSSSMMVGIDPFSFSFLSLVPRAIIPSLYSGIWMMFKYVRTYMFNYILCHNLIHG